MTGCGEPKGNGASIKTKENLNLCGSWFEYTHTCIYVFICTYEESVVRLRRILKNNLAKSGIGCVEFL